MIVVLVQCTDCFVSLLLIALYPFPFYQTRRTAVTLKLYSPVHKATWWLKVPVTVTVHQEHLR